MSEPPTPPIRAAITYPCGWRDAVESQVHRDDPNWDAQRQYLIGVVERRGREHLRSQVCSVGVLLSKGGRV